MNKTSILVGAALLAMSGAALANDTTAQLGTGGLVFVTNENIEMAAEDLTVGPEQVKVVYKFNNKSDTPQHILVAFPMPDIEGSGDFMTAVPVFTGYGDDAAPVDDPDNLFDFATTFNGKPVDATLHQYAFNNNIDYSEMLRKLNVPLEPFGGETTKVLNGLDKADQAKLVQLGLVIPMEYDDGSGTKTDYTPVWTLRSTYSWEATFAPGESDVVHTYKPSVGGTVATTFMPVDGDQYSQDRFVEYQKKYCVDDTLVKALKKVATTADGYTNYPYVESWISYIWSTGANWGGPIGKFTLTVDKGKADSLVSFCGEGVKKIDPTTFQMTATDWYPPYGQELEILLLNKNDYQP
ncbi:DUF4424 domain-containing protein [Devosia sp.]|uniref:DUF4424 domain-containing protein n=1 Tax=Devosia sp. TaxID=1871048 RepID=UPI0032642CE5